MGRLHPHSEMRDTLERGLGGGDSGKDISGGTRLEKSPELKLVFLLLFRVWVTLLITGVQRAMNTHG